MYYIGRQQWEDMWPTGLPAWNMCTNEFVASWREGGAISDLGAEG